MEINTTDFNVKKEILFNGTIKYICTPKERKCDNDRCNKQIRYDKLNLIKFPTVKDGTRYMIDALICNKCYPEIIRMVNDNRC